MILTRNQSPGSWAEVFGDRVIATAILDRILHHAITVNIRGNSYRLKEKLKGWPRPPRRGHGVNPGVGNFQLPRLGRFGLPLTLRAPRVDESVCRLGGRDRPRPRRMCGAPHRGRLLGLSEVARRDRGRALHIIPDNSSTHSTTAVQGGWCDTLTSVPLQARRGPRG